VLPPDQDIDDRTPIWDYLQVFWMDTDPEILFPRVVDKCAASKYSLDELKQIFWNEVEPAVGFNMWSIAGEWAGFDVEWLVQRILKKSRFGKPLPNVYLRPQARNWWKRLAGSIEAKRDSLSREDH
jgi:hypothetical protein